MASPPRGAIVATHSPDGPREFWLCRVDGAAARGRLKATWLERRGSTGATYELGGAQQGGIEQSSVVCEVERGWTGGATFRLTAAHRRTINAALNSAEDAAGSADDDEEAAEPQQQAVGQQPTPRACHISAHTQALELRLSGSKRDGLRRRLRGPEGV